MTTSASSEVEVTGFKRFCLRWGYRLFVLINLTFLVAQVLTTVVSIYPELVQLFVTPRVENYQYLKWVMALYIAGSFCFCWFLGGLAKFGYAESKKYAVE